MTVIVHMKDGTEHECKNVERCYIDHNLAHVLQIRGQVETRFFNMDCVSYCRIIK